MQLCAFDAEHPCVDLHEVENLAALAAAAKADD